MNKILYIHHGTSQGGAPRSLAFLISNLNKTKFKPYVLCCFDEEGNRELYESVGAEFCYEKYMGPWHGSTVSGISFDIMRNNIKYLPFTYTNVIKHVKKIQPDIVHINSTCLWVAAKAIKKYDHSIPIVCHVREPLLKGLWGNILRKGCNRYIDEYVAIEKFDAYSLGNTTKPVNIVYNFVDFDVYNSTVKSDKLREEFGLAKTDTVILYLARIAPSNGALEMLDKLETYLNQNTNRHLFIVGANTNSKDKYSAEVAQKSNKHSNVHILPFRNDVVELITSSDIMVVPFQEPHFARSIIEAAAMGVPSVASDIPGPQELLIDGETGFLVDYRTFDGLDEKIELLASDAELRKSIGKNAECFARENFDAVKNSEKTFEIYRRLLNKK